MPASPDVWMIDRPSRNPEEREQLQLEHPVGSPALAIFTTAERARNYRAQALMEAWEVTPVPRAIAIDLLADLATIGLSHVVFDPTPDASGNVVPVFRAIIDLQ